MQLGMIGLGRMGANMVRRLMRGGHDCVVWDTSPDNVKQLAGEGAVGAASLDDFGGEYLFGEISGRPANTSKRSHKSDIVIIMHLNLRCQQGMFQKMNSPYGTNPRTGDQVLGSFEPQVQIPKL